MAQLLKNYLLFISGPSDVSQEHTIIKKVVEEINIWIIKYFPVSISTFHYVDDVYPNINENPQEVVDEQLREAEIFVGVFSKRCGTPVSIKDKTYNSGSEKEFYTFLENKKDGNYSNKIMVYFNESPLPSDIDLKQYSKVLEFKENIKPMGIVFPFREIENFHFYVYRHLLLALHSFIKADQILEAYKINKELADLYMDSYIDKIKICGYLINPIGPKLVELSKSFIESATSISEMTPKTPEAREYAISKMFEMKDGLNSLSSYMIDAIKQETLELNTALLYISRAITLGYFKDEAAIPEKEEIIKSCEDMINIFSQAMEAFNVHHQTFSNYPKIHQEFDNAIEYYANSMIVLCEECKSSIEIVSEMSTLLS